MTTPSPRVTCARLLGASAEELVNIFCRFSSGGPDDFAPRLRRIGAQLGLTSGELACGLGFNLALPELPDVLDLLGPGAMEALLNARDACLCQDVYRELSLEAVLAIHSHAALHPAISAAQQALVEQRLATLEACIERTVHAPTIERYRNELRSLYRLGLMPLERFEARMQRRNDGFRALVNEVLLAAETRLVPVGMLLYRDDILPREKQQLVRRGLVPVGLIAERLACAEIAPVERELLQRELRLLQPARAGTSEGEPIGAGRTGD